MLNSKSLNKHDWADKLEAALAQANIPTLLMVLFHLTGDRKWLADDYRCSRITGLDDNDSGGLPEVLQAEVRETAKREILRWENGSRPALPSPSPHDLAAMLEQSVGEHIPSSYGPMISAWLGLDPEFLLEPSEAFHIPHDYKVVVIGAGVAGICAAIRLEAAGIPYLVIDKNSDAGGTWYENRYPGAGVDTPNHIYSFSFAKGDWSKYFALREEIQDYFLNSIEKFGIRKNMRFGIRCERLTYDERSARWDIDVAGLDGRRERLVADVVISAVGILNIPKYPKIDGLDSFKGDCFHTARWPEGFSVDSKRVGIIGNGASAMQVVPAIADRAQHLTVFQRSKQWAAPFERFKKNVPDPVRFLLREVPFYQEWYRQRLAWVFNDRIHSSLQIDPKWPHPERAINSRNDKHREYFEKYIKSEIGERQDLLPEVLPDYPPFGKRMLLDNGWYRTMTKPNVSLVNSPITRIDDNCVETEDGSKNQLDVLIVATGFDAVNFLSSLEVIGRKGEKLSDRWEKEGAEAYLGMSVPGFPNLFVLAGPNTALGHGGSVVASLETQARYVLGIMKKAMKNAAGARFEIEVRRDVHDQFNQRVQQAHNTMIWSHNGMSNWYRNPQGKIVAPTPFRNDDYWHMLQATTLGDFHLRAVDAENEVLVELHAGE